jgi:multisubunit Na+/H+ antiporter MnhF subunit
VNVWLVAATVLLAGLVPCAWVLVRGELTEALVALELSSTLVTVVLVLLSEGFHRSSYFTLPLVLAGLQFVGTLVFVRFLGDRFL